MKRSAAGVFSPTGPRPLTYPSEVIIAALEPIALPERVARIERAVAARVGSVVVVIESLADPHNAAAILRTCDGLGVGEVHVVERDTNVLITTAVTKGCEKWMDLRRHARPESCVAALHARGFRVYAADMAGPVALDAIADAPGPVALAFGNEHAGVSAEMRAAADGAFAVPMYGMVESYNVSVAAAMAVFAVRRTRAGDLGSERASELKARFLMESVREPELIIARYARDHGITAGDGRGGEE
jgi:tRNA (guanosine-2'-O-)-methyltransferase